MIHGVVLLIEEPGLRRRFGRAYTLTISRHAVSPMGTLDQTFVLERASSQCVTAVR